MSFQQYTTSYAPAPAASAPKYQPNGSEMCTRGCNGPAKPVQSNSAKNPGRFFWGCNARCDGFGGWCDEGPPGTGGFGGGGTKRKAVAEIPRHDDEEIKAIKLILLELMQKVDVISRQNDQLLNSL